MKMQTKYGNNNNKSEFVQGFCWSVLTRGTRLVRVCDDKESLVFTVDIYVDLQKQEN